MRPAGRCYLVAESTGWSAFVPVVGGFMKTHWCVVVTKCPACKAMPGQPCYGSAARYGRSQTSSTHVDRRALAQQMKKTPAIRKKLLRALPVIAFSLDALADAFGSMRLKSS